MHFRKRARRPDTKGRRTRRRVYRGLLAAVAVTLAWAGVSFSGYVRDSQGEPTSVLLAEWGRDHHLGSVVAAAENFYYSHIATVPVGGAPALSPVIDPSAAGGGFPGQPPAITRAHLQPPPTVISPAPNPLPLEGVWQPVGTKVSGLSAIYATRVRPDLIHTSIMASMMWIDTDLTKTILVPGYIEPGGPAPSQGALPKQLWPSILANFNGGFRLQDSQGGYYYQGQVVAPLVVGKASAVLYKDGTVKIGKWGRDATMTPEVAVVLQNLDLIVDEGHSNVSAGSGFLWGATTHGESYAWRSAIGQRADGSLIYIGSPGLSASSMASTLVRAGVVRAMVLDMNNWWVAGFYFNHAPDGSPICTKLDPAIQEGCDRFLKRYKRDSFQILAAP